MMRRSPGFTVVAVLSLSLGIGANTAIFSLINTLMLRLLRVKDPQQLVELLSRYPGEPRRNVNQRFAASLIQDLPANSSTPIVFGALVMTTATILAAYVPARRAASGPNGSFAPRVSVIHEKVM
jgi:hypothetical protein